MTAATCCSSFSRFCLICVNIISLVVGMLVLGIGIWMAITPEGLYEALNNHDVPFVPSILKPEAMNTDLVLAVLVLGSITFLTGTVGFWGAALHSRCMLKTFAILMLLFITAEVVPSVMMWIKLRGEREKTMLLERVEGRCAAMHRNVSSLPIALCHLTFVAFECCGFNNYTDFIFTKGEKWKVPWSCCMMRNKLRLIPEDEFCPANHDEDSINTEGCNKTIYHYLLDNYVNLIIIAVTLLIFQILLQVCALSTKKYKNKFNADKAF